MRLKLFILSIFIAFTHCHNKVKAQPEFTVITQFLDENYIQKKEDFRKFLPPPPPELQDGTYYEGKLKSDSIIRNLEPRVLYVRDSISYHDEDTGYSIKHPEYYAFVNKRLPPLKKSNFLDINILNKNKFIILKSISLKRFLEIESKVRFDNNYGGFLSFQNLVFSENQKKAYFEIILYKSKLNASKYAVYAHWDYDKWIYKLQMLSIS